LIELARRKRSGLIVHVCGTGPLEAEIRQQFQAIQNHQVQLYFEQDPFRVLLRTKVYVSLQDTENYPSQSLLEAMACGCAVVATDVGLTRHLLDESCALLVPRDPVALADALAYLLEKEPMRGSLGRNAQRIATSTHTIERFAAYFVDDVLQGAT
jgi:glycosyltransferase involved in cell wall biosynthesis